MEEDWSRLPPHVIQNIMKNLNVTDLIKVSRTNKWYNKLATSNKVWKPRCLELRKDILFLTIVNAKIPEWLEHLEDLKKPPPNFYFCEFMQLYSQFPHAWKRGNQIVNTAYIRFKEFERPPPGERFFLTTKEGYLINTYTTMESYINWRKYYRVEIPQTIWLHNRRNGAYEIRRNTLKEPFYFQLPFSNKISHVSSSGQIVTEAPGAQKVSLKLSNKKLEKRLEKIQKVLLVTAVASFTVAIGITLLDVFTSYSVPYHIISNRFLKDDICEIVYPTAEKLLDPNFQGSIVHTLDYSKVTNLGAGGAILGSVSGVSAAFVDAVKDITAHFGLSSLFAYDTVQFFHPNNDDDISIFVTTEDDPTKYECTVLVSGLTVPSEWASYWVHDMDQRYDPLGNDICANCKEHPGAYRMEGYSMLGSFCGKSCANQFWEK